jgi:hypothetical protein
MATTIYKRLTMRTSALSGYGKIKLSFVHGKRQLHLAINELIGLSKSYNVKDFMEVFI